MSDFSAFRRSRIYAQGWNAAREPRTGGALREGAVNPYTSELEKSRWDEGYANALRSNRQQQVRFIPARAATDPVAE
jgi:hypothetical protein